MSGVELLPFVWALPVAYIAASYGTSPREDQGPEIALPGHWNLDRESSSQQRFHREQHERRKKKVEIIDDESIEVLLTRKGCTCFLV